MSDQRFSRRALVAAHAVGLQASDDQVERAWRQMMAVELTWSQVARLSEHHFDRAPLEAALLTGAVVALDLDGVVVFSGGPMMDAPVGLDLLGCCRSVGAAAVARAIEAALEGETTRHTPGYQPFEASPMMLRGDVVGAVLVRLA